VREISKREPFSSLVGDVRAAGPAKTAWWRGRYWMGAPRLAMTLWPPSAEEDLMDETTARGIGESNSGRKGDIHD
jgi:hypothetical protein